MYAASPLAKAYIGLGSNLGDRLAALRAAVKRLAEDPQISIDFGSGIASLYESSPIGRAAGPRFFLNSALCLRTTLSPAGLLDVLLSIEASLGRPARAREGARTVDLDLLLYEDLVVQDASLTIPHPCLHERRFVLEPLSEIAADIVHPILQTTISALAHRRRLESPKEELALHSGPEWPDAQSTERGPITQAPPE